MFGLFGRRGKKGNQYLICETADDFDDYFDIVGESHYQAALNRIAGGKTEESVEIDVDVFLISEPENSYDSDAVKVVIDGQKVGHLSRQHTESFHNITRSLGIDRAKCEGLIVGGWKRSSDDEGSFGVKLDLKWPIRGKLSE